MNPKPSIAVYDAANVYRIASSLGGTMLLLGYLYGEASVTGSDRMGLVAASALALLAAVILASFLSRRIYAALGECALGISLLFCGYFSLWLIDSTLHDSAITNSLLFAALSTLIFHKPKLVAGWSLCCSLILISGAFRSDAGTTAAVAFSTSLLIALSITGLTKLYILRLAADRDSNQEMADSLFEQTTDALLNISADGTALRGFNSAAAKQFNATNGQAIWSCINQALVEAGVDRKEIAEAVVRGESWTAEFMLQRVSGDDFHARVTLHRLHTARRSTIIARVTDISDLVGRQKDLERARADAERAMIVQGRFLANMSHEIRTPMNGVIGMTSLLSGTSLNEEQAGFVNIIRSSGESLLSIINEILDFSKLEAGGVELEEQEFDLEQCVADALDTVMPMASEKSLELILDLKPKDCRRLLGDCQHLRQVLVNLLSNAVKFTPRGQITVRLTVTDDVSGGADGAVADGRQRSLVTVAVTDTGIGIPAHKVATLFDAFTQADSSTTRRFGGTGLGLSISRSLVELMGGSLTAESVEGEGATFRFFVSMVDLGLAVSELPRDLTGLRVASVDDNHTNRLVLRGMLNQFGALGTDYAAPEALLDDDSISRADLIITDMAMPQLDGVQLANKLRQQAELQNQPLPPMILLTSLDQGQVDTTPFAATLYKPVRPSELSAAIRRALGTEPAGSRSKHTTTRTFHQLGLRALLAEDNIVNQKVARQMLQKLGVHVDAVANGREAIQEMTRTGYRLVFMDMQMPEVDGLEATRLLRLDDRLPQPYIIAMTANARDEDRRLCLDAGMNDFVPKPVRIDDVRLALERALEHPTLNGGASDPVGSPAPDKSNAS